MTLDDVLTILDKHYNNVKALDALNQELFQLRNGWKRDSIAMGGASIETPLNSHGVIPRMIPIRPCSQVKVGPLLQWATKVVKGNGGLLGRPLLMKRLTLIMSMWHGRLRRKRQLNCLTIQPKPKMMSFSPLWKLEGTLPTMTSTVWVMHLEEEVTDKERRSWEWRSWWHQRHNGGIHGAPCQGGENAQ